MSWHSKRANPLPVSIAEKRKFAVAVEEGLVGPDTIETSGATLSIIQENEDVAELPKLFVARTLNECEPSGKFVKDTGLVQAAKAPLSRLQAKLLAVGLAKVKLASRSRVSVVTFGVRVKDGAARSMIHE